MAEISFIEDGKELLNDIEKKVGKKGLAIILGGLGLAGLYLALKSFNKSNTATNEMVTATGYIGYPEAEENADVIISEVTDEITGSGSSIMSMFQNSEHNILAELDELKETTNAGFSNIEQLQGEQTNKENSNLTNGTVGGDFVNTDKGNVKDTVVTETEVKDTVVKDTVVTEVPVKPNYVEGSGADLLEDIRDQYGTSNYTQEKTNEQAGAVYDNREYNKNEYGGNTYVNALGDKVTVTKTDEAGRVVEKETSNLGANPISKVTEKK